MSPGVRSPGLVRHRPTVAQIDLDAVRHNVRSLVPGRAELMAVVKANGYGHGAVPVAGAALEAGATWLGVALVEEGVRLRDAGIAAPILVLTEFPPGSEAEALAADLTPTLYTDEGLERLAAAADPTRVRPAVHVKVDTGMHRVGLPPERAPEFAARVVEAGLMLGGLWTHFAKAEETDDPVHGPPTGAVPGSSRRWPPGTCGRGSCTRRTPRPPWRSPRPISTWFGPGSASTACRPIPRWTDGSIFGPP